MEAYSHLREYASVVFQLSKSEDWQSQSEGVATE